VFKFITNRPFWVNFLVAAALAALIIWGFLQMLGIITKHGEYLTVPSVLNKRTTESVKLLESKGFTVIIQDSVYTDTAKLGTVLKQFPEGNSTVKVNRVVMLTVNRVTLPLVDMPALVGKSQDYALEILKRAHLTLGDTTFKPSYMLGAVLEQRVNGNAVAAGAKIPWGSKVDIEIGSGLSDAQMLVPSLIGLTYQEAKSILEEKGIMLASTIVDKGTTDTANAFVYKQNPPRMNEDMSTNYIRSGQVMDVWVSPVMKVVIDSAGNVIDADQLDKEENKAKKVIADKKKKKDE
jgi:eukaryotic-like serine/threonine-protein kinase